MVIFQSSTDGPWATPTSLVAFRNPKKFDPEMKPKRFIDFQWFRFWVPDTQYSESNAVYLQTFIHQAEAYLSQKGYQLIQSVI